MAMTVLHKVIGIAYGKKASEFSLAYLVYYLYFAGFVCIKTFMIITRVNLKKFKKTLVLCLCDCVCTILALPEYVNLDYYWLIDKYRAFEEVEFNNRARTLHSYITFIIRNTVFNTVKLV